MTAEERRLEKAGPVKPIGDEALLNQLQIEFKMCLNERKVSGLITRF
jgi:hypothetical protein